MYVCANRFQNQLTDDILKHLAFIKKKNVNLAGVFSVIDRIRTLWAKNIFLQTLIRLIITLMYKHKYFSEVTIIPTYDTDVLGYWVSENEDLLAKYHIDLSPSASRCTINLQDHETSCSAYRLEF